MPKVNFEPVTLQSPSFEIRIVYPEVLSSWFVRDPLHYFEVKKKPFFHDTFDDVLIVYRVPSNRYDLCFSPVSDISMSTRMRGASFDTYFANGIGKTMCGNQDYKCPCTMASQSVASKFYMRESPDTTELCSSTL